MPWSVLDSKMVLMENFLHHFYTSYMNEPFKVDFDRDFRVGPARKSGFWRKTSNCIGIYCFHRCRILPRNFDFIGYKVLSTYCSSYNNLKCMLRVKKKLLYIFRVRKFVVYFQGKKGLQWIIASRLHLQLRPRDVHLCKMFNCAAKYLLGCPAVCRQNKNSRNVIDCSSQYFPQKLWWILMNYFQ